VRRVHRSVQTVSGHYHNQENTGRAADIDEYKNIAVFIEQRGGEIAGVSFEMLGEGRKLADRLGERLLAVLLGHNMEEKAQSLVKYGADKVVYFNHEACAEFQDDVYGELVARFIRGEKPSIFLAGATAIGRSFIPKVAAKVYGGLTADCTKLEIDVEKRLLLGTRPAFGGKPDGDHHLPAPSSANGHRAAQSHEAGRFRRKPHGRSRDRSG